MNSSSVCELFNNSEKSAKSKENCYYLSNYNPEHHNNEEVNILKENLEKTWFHCSVNSDCKAFNNKLTDPTQEPFHKYSNACNNISSNLNCHNTPTESDQGSVRTNNNNDMCLISSDIPNLCDKTHIHNIKGINFIKPDNDQIITNERNINIHHQEEYNINNRSNNITTMSLVSDFVIKAEEKEIILPKKRLIKKEIDIKKEFNTATLKKKINFKLRKYNNISVEKNNPKREKIRRKSNKVIDYSESKVIVSDLRTKIKLENLSSESEKEEIDEINERIEIKNKNQHLNYDSDEDCLSHDVKKNIVKKKKKNEINCTIKKYLCKLCNFSTNNKKILFKHEKNKHSKEKDEILNCDQCKFTSKSHVTFKQHFLNDHPHLKVFPCKTSDCSFRANFK